MVIVQCRSQRNRERNGRDDQLALLVVTRNRPSARLGFFSGKGLGEADRAVGSVCPFVALGALRTDRAVFAFFTQRTLRASRAGSSGFALRARCASRTRRPGRTGRTLRTGRPPGARLRLALRLALGRGRRRGTRTTAVAARGKSAAGRGKYQSQHGDRHARRQMLTYRSKHRLSLLLGVEKRAGARRYARGLD